MPDCPAPETLREYTLGLTHDSQVLAAVEAHLDECSACQARLAAFDAQSDPLLMAVRACGRAESSAVGSYAALRTRAEEFAVTLSEESIQLDSPIATAPPRIRDCRVERFLGRGGMGTVYLAWHERLKRHVAIKLLPAAAAHHSQSIARFEREMEAAGRCGTHPNLVTTFDAGHETGTYFLVMEFVDGCHLRFVMDAVRRLPIAVACAIARSVALGLAHLHRHQLVHRDIKPSNIMVSRDGQVKLLDLGLALFGESSQFGGDLRSDASTANPTPVGTRGYMAPEQIVDANSVDGRADLYALGVTLFRMCTGEPFDAADSPISSELPRDVAARVARCRPEAPPALLAILSRLLAESRDARFASASQVVTALEPLSQNVDLAAWLDAPDAPLLLPPNATRRTRTNVAGMLVAIVSVIGLAMMLLPWSRPSQPNNRIPASDPRESRESVRPVAIKKHLESTPGAANFRLPWSSTWQPGTYHQERWGLVPRPSDLDSKETWQLETIAPHDGIFAIANAPRGNAIACGGAEGNVRIYDASTRQLRAIVYGHSDAVRGIGVSHDGSWFASAGGSTVRIFGAVEMKETAVYSVPSFARCVAWHPRNRQLAVGCLDGSLHLLDYRDDQLQFLQSFAAHSAATTSVSWNADGSSLASSGADGIRVWNFDTDRALSAAPRRWSIASTTVTPIQLAWHPHENLLAACDALGDFRLWNLTKELPGTSESTDTLHVPPTCVVPSQSGPCSMVGQSLVWSPEGELVAIGFIRGYVELRKTDGSLVHRLRTHYQPAAGIAWSPNSELLIVGMEGRQITQWSRAGQRLDDFTESSGKLHQVSFSASKNLVAVSASDGSIRCFDSDGVPKQVLAALNTLETVEIGVEWHSDGSQLAAGSVDAERRSVIRTWKHVGDQFVAGPTLPASGILVKTAADGQRFAALGSDGHVRVWNWPRNSSNSVDPIVTLQRDPKARGFAWSPDSKHVVAGGRYQPVIVVDVSHLPPEPRTLVDSAMQLTALAWGNSPSRIFASLDDKAAVAWNENGALEKFFPLPVGATQIALNRQGTLIAISLSTHDVVIYDMDHRFLYLRSGHNRRVSSLAWHPDGRHLFTGGWDGTLRLVDARTGECLWFAVVLPNGESATFLPSGELVHATPNADVHLAYLIRPRRDRMKVESPAEFQARK